MSETLHATCVAIDGRGVLLTGPSGAGKSDLALRLIDRGASLVSDDYTFVERSGDALLATAPPTIAGRIEVREVGILAMPHIDRVPVRLLVELGEAGERLPRATVRDIQGIAVPRMLLDPRPASAPIKVELALRRMLEDR